MAEAMNVYLAGTMFGSQGRFLAEFAGKVQIPLAVLESFYYADEWTEKSIPIIQDFMLDSGAFTFMASGDHPDIPTYVDSYIDFINRNKVKRYLELDIDGLIGYEEVKRIRRQLGEETGVQPIPVWHKRLGIEEFYAMCDEYPYVAIGGIVSKEIVRDDWRYFPWFIREAHRRGAKIHGLGFTNLQALRKYHFDSVDSSTWTAGNRFGEIYHFDGKTIKKTRRQGGSRLADSRSAAIHNFNEWVKFQEYARSHL